MQTLWLDETITYTGAQLRSLWAFRTCGLQGDSIVAFCGPCDVSEEHMVDEADRRAGQRIYSPWMLHFIVEHFDCDLERAVLRQRLLVALTGDLINSRLGRLAVRREGDDLFAADRKLSVSIATLSPVSALIHLGLNVRTEGVPVPAVGLEGKSVV